MCTDMFWLWTGDGWPGRSLLDGGLWSNRGGSHFLCVACLRSECLGGSVVSIW